MTNAIHEGYDRFLAPDADGVLVEVSSRALNDLQHEVAQAQLLKEQGEGAMSRARSSLESRADLRAIVQIEAPQTDVANSQATFKVGKFRAKQWADLDASDYPRLRSAERKESALEGIALNMMASPEYAAELKERSPALCESATLLTVAIRQAESDRLKTITDSRTSQEDSARLALRLSVLDASAMASLAAVRAKQSEAAAELLSAARDQKTVSDLAAARIAATAAIANSKGATPADVELAAEKTRPLKRPLQEAELAGALAQRYIITTEKVAGLLSKGRTEFTHRSGDKAGQLAFCDAGKTLTTELQDKSTVRAMIEVAKTKNWKEITVTGTEEFRRTAWLEARVNGLAVKGYEPREADKQMLAGLVPPEAAKNAVTLKSPNIEPPRSAEPVSHGKRQAEGVHVDGDTLTPRQKTVIDNSRAFLRSKDFGPEWTEAAIGELESKLRGERVYIGQVVDHGAALYKFEDAGAPSYFVTLKTPLGEQTVWGKDLAAAMGDEAVGKGQSIVLQNTGKRSVSVSEQLFDDAGRPSGTREKPATRNEWTAQPLARFSEQAKKDLASRETPKQPSLAAYDVKAPRKVEPTAPGRDSQSHARNQTNERSKQSRDRG